MAKTFDLFLLSSSTESSSDHDIAVLAVTAIVSTKGAFVHTSLAKNAVLIAEAAYEKRRFDSVFTMDWDPPRNESSTFDWQLLPNDKLLSIAGQMNAEFQTIDFDHDYVEIEGNYEKRLKEKMLEPVAGTKIAIAPAPVISACLEIAGARGAATPALVALKVNVDTRRIVFQQAYDNWTAVYTFARSLDASPLVQSAMLSSQISDEDKGNQVLPSILQDQIKSLSEKFSKELSRVLNSSLQQCQMGWHDPSDHVVSSVTESLTSLNDRFSTALSSLDSRLRDIDSFKSLQRREMDLLLSEFRSINDNQKAIEAVLTGIGDSVGPAIGELNEKLRRAEEVQGELKREIEEAMTAKAIASYPLFIKNVEKGADNSYFAEIVSRKHYPVYGFLALVKADGTTVSSENTITFQSTEHVNMTNLVGLQQPGWYEVSIQHYADRSEICRRFRFSIQESGVTFPKAVRSYTDSLVYRTNQSLEETVLKTKGEAGVSLLRKLASEWLNESPDLLEDFSQVMLDPSLTEESAVRRQLVLRGIRV